MKWGAIDTYRETGAFAKRYFDPRYPQSERNELAHAHAEISRSIGRIQAEGQSVHAWTEAYPAFAK